MNGFTVPQIFINLVIAAKWTIILSIIAFVVGGIMGFLLILMRISPNKWIKSTY